mmetsp:Transcript_23429/g.32845  ORF Transcript_23429/g.32845 Transcript_23429/m.32845 type:complete len:317 (-) Transcript_23429:99-1049(-)
MKGSISQVSVLLLLCSIHHVVESFAPSIITTHNRNSDLERKSKIPFVSYKEQCNREGLNHGHQGDRNLGILSSKASSSTTSLWASSESSSISLDFLDEWYTRSADIKCPFFRRRAADMIDGIAMIGRFLLVRHKTLYTPPGCRATARQQDLAEKNLCLDQDTLYDIIVKDWRTHNNKGYFVTGRLNSTIYRDDCFFDGPDPDMPVRGVRKFVNAISQLFDSRKSTAELLSLEWEKMEDGTTSNNSKLVAIWKLDGVLMLPWRPKIPSYTGRITYHFDDNGLVYFHQEEWDISVLEAFVSTVSPHLGKRIWNTKCES